MGCGKSCKFLKSTIFLKRTIYWGYKVKINHYFGINLGKGSNCIIFARLKLSVWQNQYLKDLKTDRSNNDFRLHKKYEIQLELYREETMKQNLKLHQCLEVPCRAILIYRCRSLSLLFKALNHLLLF